MNRRIVVCGSSIFLKVIEAGLNALPRVDVICISPHHPDLMKKIAAYRPDLVVIEDSDKHNNLIVALPLRIHLTM
jgi:hypothetical protein